MVYISPNQITEEIKIFDGFYVKDLATIGCCLAIFWLISYFLADGFLQIPYWVFACSCSFYLSRSAQSTNPGTPRKQKWEAIQLMICKDPVTYHSLNKPVDSDLV